jgi:CBS domain-containing protein
LPKQGIRRCKGDVQLKEIPSFLRTVSPFGELPEEQLEALAQRAEEAVYPKGTVILRQGKSPVRALHLIKHGGVKLYLKDKDEKELRIEYRRAGDYFGALGLIMEMKANLTVESIDETSCVLVSGRDFRHLLSTEATFSLFFLESFCRRYIYPAHAELQRWDYRAQTDSGLYLFGQDLEGAMKGSLHTCLSDDTIQAAAEKMVEHRIGSLIVRGEDGKAQGIITDKDLRTKMVARGMSCHEPVSSIMTSPVQTAPAHAVCFDALFSMLKNRIHHLGVKKGGEIVGMITSHDLLLLQGDSPIFLFKEIGAAREIKGLYSIPEKFPAVARRLMHEGARAGNMNRMITVLNDYILDRILSLLITELGTPPLPFCWIVMGSEGRKEQTFVTDQDNAIIYEDPSNASLEAEAREYFLALGRRAVEDLAKCGYKLCKGEIMASNPKWNLPLSEWKELFDHWIYSPDPREVLHATIFFDFRPGFGETKLAHSLRMHLVDRACREKVFIHHLARDCLATKPALSIFKNFVVEKDGPHRGHLDLKAKGLTPFVDFARLMSLDRGVTVTNTLERIRALQENHALSEDFAIKVREAYEFQMHLRLTGQLHMIEGGREPDNYVNPSAVSEMEKRALKQAFLVVSEIQAFITDFFHLNLG